MIALQERQFHQEIFNAILSSVQELHPDRVLMKELHSAPFLLKSQDARVWVRIFYRSMRDYSLEELKYEIKKLWVLMPQEAQLYLFYPALDHAQLLKMNGFSDRLSFFEYGRHSDPEKSIISIRIRKWIPSESLSLLSAQEPNLMQAPASFPNSFLQKTRLTRQEIAELTELGLVLKKL